MYPLMRNEKGFVAIEALGGLVLLVSVMGIVLWSLSQLFFQMKTEEETIALYHELSNYVVTGTYGQTNVGQGRVRYEMNRMIIEDGSESFVIEKMGQE